MPFTSEIIHGIFNRCHILGHGTSSHQGSFPSRVSIPAPTQSSSTIDIYAINVGRMINDGCPAK